jgi:hypothetical protein
LPPTASLCIWREREREGKKEAIGRYDKKEATGKGNGGDMGRGKKKRKKKKEKGKNKKGKL